MNSSTCQYCICCICLVASLSNGAFGEDFGDRQVDQLLDDRPELISIVKKHDCIYCWLSARFGGKGIADRILWDASEPVESLSVAHLVSDRLKPATIRVTSSEAVSSKDKCIAIVFDLLALENEEAFKGLCKKALARRIDRARFVQFACELHLVTAQKAMTVLQEDCFSPVHESQAFNNLLKLAKLEASENNAILSAAKDRFNKVFDALTRER